MHRISMAAMASLALRYVLELHTQKHASHVYTQGKRAHGHGHTGISRRFTAATERQREREREINISILGNEMRTSYIVG